MFILVGTAASAAGIPRQGVAFLGGYGFGAAAGTGLAMLAQVLGCALSFGWARLVGRGWAERRLAGRFGRRLRPLRDALAANPFGAMVALRLLPVGNNLALNLLAGMAGIAALPFLAGSALGYLPRRWSSRCSARACGWMAPGRWGCRRPAAVSVAIGFRLLRRHRAGQALDDQAPEGAGR